VKHSSPINQLTVPRRCTTVEQSMSGTATSPYELVEFSLSPCPSR